MKDNIAIKFLANGNVILTIKGKIYDKKPLIGEIHYEEGY